MYGNSRNLEYYVLKGRKVFFSTTVSAHPRPFASNYVYLFIYFWSAMHNGGFHSMLTSPGQIGSSLPQCGDHGQTGDINSLPLTRHPTVCHQRNMEAAFTANINRVVLLSTTKSLSVIQVGLVYRRNQIGFWTRGLCIYCKIVNDLCCMPASPTLTPEHIPLFLK